MISNNKPPIIKDTELTAKVRVCFIGFFSLSRLVISKLAYDEIDAPIVLFNPRRDSPFKFPPIEDIIEITIKPIPSKNRTSFKLYPLELTKSIAITKPITAQIAPNNITLNKFEIKFLFIDYIAQILKNLRIEFTNIFTIFHPIS